MLLVALQQTCCAADFAFEEINFYNYFVTVLLTKFISIPYKQADLL